LVLGDLDRAESFLSRALDLDGAAPDLLYRHARVLESQGARADAIDQLCRALGVGTGAEDIGDAQHRLDSLIALDRPALSPSAIAAFDRGVAMAEQGQTAGAAAAFEAAVREEPNWAPAAYNAGVVYAQRGERAKAMEQLRRYLALAPGAPDAVAVSRAIGRWEAEATTNTNRGLPDPGATLALGLFLPGTGQFYSGRPWPGVGVLAVAVGSIATGLLVREVSVRCVGTAQPSGSCPPDQVVGRSTRRPHLGLAIGVAAAVTAIGAVEAFFRAKDARGGSTFVTARSGNDLVLLSIGAP
jgi:tetratricopeptide (TPR) repeat protein